MSTARDQGTAVENSGGTKAEDTAKCSVQQQAEETAEAQPADGWFYLTDGQHVGPLSTEHLIGYHTSGYVAPTSLVWRSGRSKWQPLQDIPELAVALRTVDASSTAATASAVAAADGADLGGRDSGNAVQTTADVLQMSLVKPAGAKPAGSRGGGSAPVLTAAAQQHDPMAAFLGEISAIEADEGATEDAPASPDERWFVDDDGTAYEWDTKARRFVESGAANAAEAQAAAADASFDQSDQTFSFEAEVIPAMPEPDLDSEDEAIAAATGGEGKHKADKRKVEDAIERENAKKAKAKEDTEKKANWFQLQQNSSVYVTGLPSDVTDAEMVATFTKCGVIKLDDERRPRIKAYKNEDGSGKGDGLVTYLKQPSVDLALQILDGTCLRDGDTQTMTITQAKFEQKGKFVAKKGGSSKQRKKRVLEKQEQSELGWGGFDDVAPPTKTTVVIRHAFHPDDFAADFTLREQLEDDFRDESERLGVVENVKIYNTNPQGVVAIKFRMEDAAQACITLMHSRFFGGRQLEAALWDGIEKFYVKPVIVKETEEEQVQRLDRYAAELEQGKA